MIMALWLAFWNTHMVPKDPTALVLDCENKAYCVQADVDTQCQNPNIVSTVYVGSRIVLTIECKE